MSIVISDIKNPYPLNATPSGAISTWTYLADIKNISNMYPYGMSYPAAATYSADDDYRFGFNGMEKEKSFDSEGNVSDFGARFLDSEYPIFGSPDPLERLFPGYSPYVALGNNPINIIDEDGRRMIFVNGYWNTILSYFNLAPDSGGEAYWNHFHKNIISVAREFAEVKNSETNVFIDGSSLFAGDMSGEDRFKAGYEFAKENYETLTEGMEKGETFKIVGHSEGCAFGSGIAAYMVEKEHNAKLILSLSPDEADEYSNPIQPITYQIHFDNDVVSPPSKVRNTNYYLLLDGASTSNAHGKSVTPFAINELQRFLKLDELINQENVKIPYRIVSPGGVLEKNENDPVEKNE